jgi:hypothetical protein
MNILSEKERALAAEPNFPFSYLNAHAETLTTALAAALDPTPSDRAGVDRAISFSERLRLVVSREAPQSAGFPWSSSMATRSAGRCKRRTPPPSHSWSRTPAV